MFWYDELGRGRAEAVDEEMAEQIRAVLGVRAVEIRPPSASTAADESDLALVRAVLRDDMQLFDRSLGWPMHQKRAFVAAEERVIVDGEPAPDMVKAIFIVSKLPGLTLSEFFERWRQRHGALAARTPGLRRYVQNHAVPDAYARGGQTHDGWSELWFDDLAALRHAVASPEWMAVRDDGETLFAAPIGVGVARVGVQKDLGWTYHDWGVGEMDTEEIRSLLMDQGYTSIAADPHGPSLIKAAAAREALAVWTPEHLVTIDAARIDIRSNT